MFKSKLDIIPISTLEDSYHCYSWLIRSDQDCYCVDIGEAKPVLQYLEKHHLSLNQIWITHGHWDHINGFLELKKHYHQALVLGSSLISGVEKALEDNEGWVVGKAQIKVWKTPGHKRDHFIYLLKMNSRFHVFTGDVLFGAGCGRVLDGTIEELYQSLQRINSLPEDTLIYSGHSMIQSNLKFASYIEPNNSDIKEMIKNQVQEPTSLAQERKINPFLRIGEERVIERVQKLSPSKIDSSPFSIFRALRVMKDQF